MQTIPYSVLVSLLGMRAKTRKHKTISDSEAQTQIENACVVCKRYAKPRTKSQARQLQEAQAILEKHSIVYIAA